MHPDNDRAMTAVRLDGAPRVAIVDLGRDGALGAARRVDSWQLMWAAAGADVTTVRLVKSCPAGARDMVSSLPECLRRRDIAPESVVWSRRGLAALLAETTPDVVVCTTVRSYHPSVLSATSGVVVLDYVDLLSESYRQRAAVATTRLHASMFTLLSRRLGKVELAPTPAAVVRTAAGAADAATLAAEWVPNVLRVPRAAKRTPDVDLLFVGSLGYPPNVDAIRRLARMWPELQSRRPGTSLLLAGAKPTPEVRALAASAGWQLAADFSSLDAVTARARVSVAPLAHATGIQNKVLETAARGLPQVLDAMVAKGLGERFPALTAGDDDEFVTAVVRLLGHPDEAERLGLQARRYVEEHFAPERWAGWCARVLTSAEAA